MNIDLVKVSELAFGALLQALLGAIIVYVTFRLGQRESDRNWRREREQTREDKQFARTLRYIDAIQRIIDLHGVFETRVYNGVPFTEDETVKIKSETLKALSTFAKYENPGVRYNLRGLHYLVLRQSPSDVQEIQKRTDLLKKMLDGLKTELVALEDSLYQDKDEFSFV
jgi:hypothetical protein